MLRAAKFMLILDLSLPKIVLYVSSYLKPVCCVYNSCASHDHHRFTKYCLFKLGATA